MFQKRIRVFWFIEINFDSEFNERLYFEKNSKGTNGANLFLRSIRRSTKGSIVWEALSNIAELRLVTCFVVECTDWSECNYW